MPYYKTTQLPKYPKFRKLLFSDQTLFESYCSNFDAYSEGVFSLVYCWNKPNQYAYISELNGNLLIKQLDILQKKYSITVWGSSLLDETANELIKNFKEIKFVPKEIAEKLDTSKFVSIPDRDDFDYIYSTNEISSLLGGKFRNRRNLIRDFELKNSNIRVEVHKNLDSNLLDEVRGVYKLWEEGRNGEKDSSKNYENIAFSRYIKHRNFFKSLYTLIYINNKLSAVAINDISRPHCAICAFVKADPQYKSLLSFTFYKNCINVLNNGINYVNAENDLGLDYMRMFKLLWRPVRFNEKFTILAKD